MERIEAILNAGEYRYFGLRNEPTVEIGSMLPNSWHNVEACDWVDEDTELDGTCCFFLQHPDLDSLRVALRALRSYWPDAERIILIGGSGIGTTDLPEDGSMCLREAVALAEIEM